MIPERPLDAALAWSQRGFWPVPVKFRSKKPFNPQDPSGSNWQHLRISQDDAACYFNGQPLNIGILLGDDYGSADVDLDCGEAIAAAPMFLPATGMRFGRPSKPASHWIYRLDPPIASTTFVDPVDKKVLLELRCLNKDGSVGHQTVVPPSTHPSGELIRFEPGFERSPANIDANDLLESLRTMAAAALLAKHWPEAGAGRHKTMLALAGVLQRSLWIEEDAVRFCVAVYRCVSTHDPHAVARTEAEIRDTFRNASAGKSTTGIPTLQDRLDRKVVDRALDWLGIEPVPPRTQSLPTNRTSTPQAPRSGSIDLVCGSFAAGDLGNAERLIAVHGSDLRYNHDFAKWLVWDGCRWSIDGAEEARKRAQDTMVDLLRQALATGNKDLVSFATRSLKSPQISYALREAQPHLHISTEELDSDPWLLNFANGTLDLRNAQLRPHQRQDFITKVVHHNYRADAECPAFIRFLERIMGGGPDASEAGLERAERLMSYLQKAFGYALTGITSQKAVFILHGSGNNGKSTLLATFFKILQEYSVLLQIDTLMVRQENNNTQADLADLRGARFVMTSETEEGQRLAEGKLKRITQGMGKIKAVRKYENPIEFFETHKLFMDANHKPVVRGTDNAIWNRLHPVPFSITIPPEEIDQELPGKLHAEAEGILAWAVAGTMRWKREGLGKPPEVADEESRWRAESDPLRDFVEDCCIVNPGLDQKAASLWQAYQNWAEENGERHSLTRKKFTDRLQLLGCEPVKRKYGRSYSERGWTGIGLRTPLEGTSAE